MDAKMEWASEALSSQRSRMLRAALDQAVGQDDAAGCLAALRLGASANDGPLGITPLMQAAMDGSAACVEVLAPWSDASLRTEGGMSAMLLAANYGNLACLKILAPGREGEVDETGRSALSIAAWRGALSCVEWLLGLAATQTLSADSEGRTALMAAAAGGRVDCARLLLARPDGRAQALARAHDGRDALMFSLMNCRCDDLLAPLSDLEARDRHGMRTLDRMISWGQEDRARRIREIQALALAGELSQACEAGRLKGPGRL
jgi:ankyrin repeat protein